MSVTLSAEKNELIDDVAKRQGFSDYEVKVTTGSMKGDGYLGLINTINIQDTNKPNKKLYLIMKSALTEEKLRENTPVRKAYEREIYMYQTVFPLLKKLSEEVGIKNTFNETAKCYGSLLTDQQESIILENLREIDFKLWNRKEAMNEEHVALVFKTYAKFHAAGIVLKLLKPETFEEMSKNLKNIFNTDDEEAEKQRFAVTAKAIFENGFRAVAADQKATEAMARFTQNFLQFFAEHVRKVDKYCTILHGDCWCNNMMFRYDDLKSPSTPTGMCLLDWQLSQIGSPILDLSYFFYACSSKEVLYDLKKFLKIYHVSFSKTITEAGLNPEEVMSYEELENQWKIYSKFGLFMALLVMKVILGEVEDAPDLSELAKKSGKNLLESISAVDSTNMEAIDKRIADVIIFMTHHDYL